MPVALPLASALQPAADAYSLDWSLSSKASAWLARRGHPLARFVPVARPTRLRRDAPSKAPAFWTVARSVTFPYNPGPWTQRFSSTAVYRPCPPERALATSTVVEAGMADTLLQVK